MSNSPGLYFQIGKKARGCIILYIFPFFLILMFLNFDYYFTLQLIDIC